MRIRAALALLVVACGGPDDDASPPVDPGPLAVEPAQEVDVTPVDQVASMAAFRGSELDECIDMRIRLAPAEGAAWNPQQLPDVAAQLRDRALESSTPEAGTRVVAIRRPCEEQFDDRPALASCTIVPPDAAAAAEGQSDHPVDGLPEGVEQSRSMVSHYYRAETVLSDDTWMRQCLEVGGDWEAVPRDSRAAREAQLLQAQQDSREALEESRQLQRRLGGR